MKLSLLVVCVMSLPQQASIFGKPTNIQISDENVTSCHLKTNHLTYNRLHNLLAALWRQA